MARDRKKSETASEAHSLASTAFTTGSIFGPQCITPMYQVDICFIIKENSGGLNYVTG